MSAAEIAAPSMLQAVVAAEHVERDAEEVEHLGEGQRDHDEVEPLVRSDTAPIGAARRSAGGDDRDGRTAAKPLVDRRR